MSFEDEVNIRLVVDTSQAQAEVNELQQNTDKITSRWASVRRTIKREMSNIVQTMRGVIGLVRSIFNAVGISLNPVQTAIIGAIETSLVAVLAIHRLMELGTAGIAGAITVGLSALSVGIAVSAIVLAEAGMEDARRQMGKAENVASSALSLVQSLQGFG